MSAREETFGPGRTLGTERLRVVDGRQIAKTDRFVPPEPLRSTIREHVVPAFAAVATLGVQVKNLRRTRNLKYMRAFAEAWPDGKFVQQAAAQLPWFHLCTLIDKLKTLSVKERVLSGQVPLCPGIGRTTQPEHAPDAERGADPDFVRITCGDEGPWQRGGVGNWVGDGHLNGRRRLPAAGASTSIEKTRDFRRTEATDLDCSSRSARKLAVQSCADVGPVAFEGTQRNSEGDRCFIHVEAGEEAEFDDRAFVFVERAEGIVDGRHEIEIVAGDHVEVFEIELSLFAAEFLGRTAAGAIDQEVVHHARGREKKGATIAVVLELAVEEAHPRFMGDGRRLDLRRVCKPREFFARQTAKVVVDDRQETLGLRRIVDAGVAEDRSDGILERIGHSRSSIEFGAGRCEDRAEVRLIESMSEVRRIFTEALDLDDDARAAFVEVACCGNDDLRRDVEDLLRHAPRVPRAFLDTSVGRSGPVAGTTREGPDRTIGGYRLLREIGRGGQGVVYLARKGGADDDVALKVVRRGPMSGPSELRFRREAAVLGRLAHPFICRTIEAGVDEGFSFIAMPFLEGETLAKKIARAKSDCPDARRSCVDLRRGDVPSTDDDSSASAAASLRRLLAAIEKVARALHVAHETGIVHRDVKPSNILVRDDGEPILMDFGLARDEATVEPSITVSGDFLGTPTYMAPEQIKKSRAEIDRRVDVWALGVCLFECLTLDPPFVAATRELLLAEIVEREPNSMRALNPDIPKDLATIVETALQKDRDRRYQTAEALADDLQRFRSFEPIRARPVGRIEKLRRWAVRNPGTAIGLFSTIVSLSAGLFASMIYLRRAQDAQRTAENRTIEADRERAAGERRAAAANLFAAHAAVEFDDVATARRHLFLVPEELRDFEWHWIERLSDTSRETVTIPGRTIRSIDVGSPGRLLLTDDVGGVHERAMLGAEGDEKKGAAPRAIEFSVLMTDWYHGRFDVRDAAGRIVYSGRGRNAVASSDGRFVIAGNVDRRADLPAVVVYDARSGERIIEFDLGRERAFATADIDASGRFVAVGLVSGSILVFERRTLALHAQLRGHEFPVRTVRFTPDERFIVSLDAAGVVKIHDAVRSAAPHVIASPGFGSQSVGFSADGRRAFALQWGRVTVVDGDLGVEIWSRWFSRKTAALARFSADGRRIAVWHDGVRLTVYDAQTSETLEEREIPGSRKTIHLAALDHGDFALIDADGCVLLAVAAGPADAKCRLDRVPSAIAEILETGHILAGFSDGRVARIDVRTGREIWSVPAHDGAVTSVSVGAKLFATGGVDKRAIVRSLADGSVVRTVTAAASVASVAIAADGGRLFLADDARYLRIFDAGSGCEMLSIRDRDASSPILAMAFDGSAWRCADRDRRLIALESRSPACGDLERGRRLRARRSALELFRSGTATRTLAEVTAEIERGQGISEDERCLVTATARALGDDLNRLNGFAWEKVAVESTKDEVARALTQAQYVAAILADDPDIANTLAVALLRAGRFEAAIAAARRSGELYAAQNRTDDPGNRAVVVLSLVRLSRIAEARAEMDALSSIPIPVDRPEDLDVARLIASAKAALEAAENK